MSFGWPGIFSVPGCLFFVTFPVQSYFYIGVMMKPEPLEIIKVFYPADDALRNMLLKHSVQVKDKALQILSGSDWSGKLDVEKITVGAMLHDIGICRCHAPDIFCCGSLDYIAHGIAGGEMLRNWGKDNGADMEPFARICERHTGSGLAAEDIIRNKLPLPVRDYLPETPEEKLICLADKFFSKSGDMEEKTLCRIRGGMAKFGQETEKRFLELCRFFKVC